MRQHMASGLRIAQYLEKHPHVERVIYPPLESHPQHDLYKKQMSGFGGMISVYLKGDEVEKSKRFLGHLKVNERWRSIEEFVFSSLRHSDSYLPQLNLSVAMNRWSNFQPS